MNPIEQLTFLTENEDFFVSLSAKHALEYKQAFDEGKISKEQYHDLIDGLAKNQAIATDADRIESMLVLNRALNALMEIAGKL